MAGSIASSSDNADNSIPPPIPSTPAARHARTGWHSSSVASTEPSCKPANCTRSEIVAIVDASVEQHHRLVAAIVGKTDVPIMVLDSDRNSIEQITESLQSYRGIVALYLISQTDGQNLFPGSTCLHQFSLDAYGWQLQQWAESLSNHAKIFLYGCELVDKNQHQTFVQHLSLLTGATVIALQGGANEMG
jgi:hypothetical protein